MIFRYVSYQEYLRSVLLERRAANASYSMRAFAQNIGVSASTLSDVLSGKKNFSEETANDVATKLRLNQKQKKYFCTLVQFNSKKGSDFQFMLAAQLRVLNPKLSNAFDLELEKFNLLTEWYYTPILELTHLHEFVMSAGNIGRKLGISTAEASAALTLLQQIGLIKTIADNRYKKSEGRLLTQSPIPSRSLRNYHRQMMMKAQESLETQTPKEKFIGSETLPLNIDDLSKASEIIENCFQQLIMLAEQSAPRDEVFHVGIQMFRLTAGKK